MTALNEIFGYLIQTLLSLYLLAMLLRFLLQLARADFYNPICRFLVKVTNPLVIPLRRVLPGFGGLDMASLLLALLLQLAGIVALLLINNLGLPNILLLLAWSVLGVIGLLVGIYPDQCYPDCAASYGRRHRPTPGTGNRPLKREL